MAILETRGLTKYFGGLGAVVDLDFDVFDLEILGLIGPNGAGKTTAFNLVTGFHAPSTGTVVFQGNDITRFKPDRIAQIGIGRTFQASTLFMQSTVFDNVFTGFHLGYKTRLWQAFSHTRSARREEEAIRQKVMEILEFMGLASLASERAENLPHGYRRILGVCVALAVNPKLLMLDEPVTGMNPTEKSEMIGLIKKIRDRGITLVVVEHDMRAIMSICDRIVVLNHGRKISEGLPEEIRENIDVIEAYLGREEAA